MFEFISILNKLLDKTYQHKDMTLASGICNRFLYYADNWITIDNLLIIHFICNLLY